ncbi:MAG TPA: hypothetical protein VEB21_02350 [Terriglobales bacterium]|nr:hypothetical protein [Terriglobales bacterium]
MSISLTHGPCWELEEGKVDSVIFFHSLAAVVPEASTAYFEGAAIAPEVADIYRRHVEPGPYVPPRETLWSVTVSIQGVSLGNDELFRCRFTPTLCKELADISQQHAEPELCDHLSLYAGDQPILEWPDAFGNCIWISPAVPENRIRAFAAALGLEYKLAQYG